jgi:hypothetical protein
LPAGPPFPAAANSQLAAAVVDEIEGRRSLPLGPYFVRPRNCGAKPVFIYEILRFDRVSQIIEFAIGMVTATLFLAVGKRQSVNRIVLI